MSEQRTPEQVLDRASRLRSEIDAVNARIAVANERFNQYVAQLEDLGLTPEALEEELERVEAEISEVAARLDEQLSAVQDAMEDVKKTV